MLWRRRKAPLLPYIYLKQKWLKDINVTNIDKLSKFKIRRVFKGFSHEEYVDKFKGYILKKYIKERFHYDDDSIMAIKAVARKLELQLTHGEWLKLERLEELSFAQNRTFKVLDVPFKTEVDEKCYFRFENGILFKRTDEKKLVKFATGMLYITNKRIVLMDTILEKEYSSRFSKFDRVLVRKYGIKLEQFSPRNEHVYACDDNLILGISMKRMLEKEEYES